MAVTLVLAAWVGLLGSQLPVLVIIAGLGGIILLQQPVLGLFGLVAATVAIPLQFNTGTEVSLNAATLLVPALAVGWALSLVRRPEWSWPASRVNPPLAGFLLAGLLSLLVGNVTWDPAVPRSGSFIMVQLAQWAIFAFAAIAFWLLPNLSDERWLQRVMWFFLLLGGGIAILRSVPGLGSLLDQLTTAAFIRAPLWVVMSGLAGGQLLFNQELASWKKLFLVAVLIAVLYQVFFPLREAVSHWAGVAATLGMLIWFRFPRVRWVIVALAIVLAGMGILFPTVYEFAGGEDEWATSGASRLTLIRRVLEVTMRNPITGLGPASYRNYANVEPLRYGQALWVNPRVNSHNNYVDIFAHTGLLGLGLFLWFAWELLMLGWQLSARYREGFVGGYVSGMTAVWVGSLVIMLLADWLLPFVYNIGFPGFQASLLVWLFAGGLLVIASSQDPHLQQETV